MQCVYVLLTLASSTEPEERSINSLRMTLPHLHPLWQKHSLCVCVHSCACARVRPCASGSLALMFRQTEREQKENPVDGEGFL